MKRIRAMTQDGLSLLELLITIAVVGILAAIAVPGYQQYVLKSRFSQVIDYAFPYRLAVEECFNQNATLLAASCDNGIGGIPATTNQIVDYLAAGSGDLSAHGALTVTITMTAVGAPGAPVKGLEGQTYTLVGTAPAVGMPMTWVSGGTCVGAGIC